MSADELPAGPPADDLARRVGELEQAFDVLMGLVEGLRTERAEKATGESPPWLDSRPDGDDLPAWVSWFNATGYAPAQPPHRIPDCWHQHPGMVAELLTLWHTWQNAFCNPDAEPEAAQNWHDRWLPGVLARIPVWVPPKCVNGKHEDTRWLGTGR